jgi:hypothetical protein
VLDAASYNEADPLHGFTAVDVVLFRWHENSHVSDFNVRSSVFCFVLK